MTEQEALAVAKAVSKADGYCSHCVNGIVEDLERDIPTVPWRTLEPIVEVQLADAQCVRRSR